MYKLNMTCPICHRIGDGCLAAEDGTAVICVREPDGAVKKAGNAGWLHILDEANYKPVKVRPAIKPECNWEKLYLYYVSQLRKSVSFLDIGLRESTLIQYGMGWNGKWFTFPMRNPDLKVIGIQKRTLTEKQTEKFSDVGLFIPTPLHFDRGLLFITEGMSDAATATELGYPAIGRYNCSSCIPEAKQFVKNYKNFIDKVIVVCDNDKVGKDGSSRLIRELKELVAVKGMNTENDLRKMYLNGLTKERVEQFIERNFK